MKNIHITREVITWLLLLLPFAYIAYVWAQLPYQIPIHFDIHGSPNNWGSKNAIFLLPGVNILVYVILMFLPSIDPKRMNSDEINSMLVKVRVVAAFFLSLLSLFITYISVHGSNQELTRWVLIICLLMFTAIGNFLINIKPNWLIGMRTPWTLSSDAVWKKTHQIVGRMWFFGGLLCAVLVYFFIDQAAYIILPFIAGSVAFSFGYSFWLYKKEQQKNMQ